MPHAKILRFSFLLQIHGHHESSSTKDGKTNDSGHCSDYLACWCHSVVSHAGLLHHLRPDPTGGRCESCVLFRMAGRTYKSQLSGARVSLPGQFRTKITSYTLSHEDIVFAQDSKFHPNILSYKRQ